MKRMFALILALVLAVSTLCACQKEEKVKDTGSPSAPADDAVVDW